MFNKISKFCKKWGAFHQNRKFFENIFCDSLGNNNILIFILSKWSPSASILYNNVSKASKLIN